MVFRIFPGAATDLVTPFRWDPRHGAYVRLVGNGRHKASIAIGMVDGAVVVEGPDWAKRAVAGQPLAAWPSLRPSLGPRTSIAFRRFVQTTLVVPTFSATPWEAYVRVVLRQVVRAGEAKRRLSRLAMNLGPTSGYAVGMPTPSQLRAVGHTRLVRLGMGFRAACLIRGSRAFDEHGQRRSSGPLPGIGPWSAKVLTSDLTHRLDQYPMDDLSGEKIRKTCGLDLTAVPSPFRGDLYAYGAAFMETLA